MEKKILSLNYNEKATENKAFDTSKPVYKWTPQLASYISSKSLLWPPRKRQEDERREGGKEGRKREDRKKEDRKIWRPLTDPVVLFPRMIQYLKKISLQKCTEFSWTTFALDLKLITSFLNCKRTHFNSPFFQLAVVLRLVRAGFWTIEGEEEPLPTLCIIAVLLCELLQTITHPHP